MTIHAIALNDWEDRLSTEIGGRGPITSASEFLDVLAAVAEPSPPLTESEHDFLLQHAGLSEDDLSADAITATDLEIATNRARAAKDMLSRAIDSQEVASRLGMKPPNVRRSAKNGDLYYIKVLPGGRYAFPLWQFPEDRLLPGLRDVIRALPGHFHPLAIETFMTEPTEVLGGISPVEWLRAGGDVGRVVSLADEKAWE